MEYIFLVLVLISIIWSTLQKLRAAKQRQEKGQEVQEPEKRPVTLAEMLRRELEKRQQELAEESEAEEAELALESAPGPIPTPGEPQPAPEREVPSEPAKTATAEPPSEARAPRPREARPKWQLDAGMAKRGIVMAEILGPCRAERPHGY